MSPSPVPSSAPTVDACGSYEEYIFAPYASDPQGIYAIDVDGDDDLDVIIGEKNSGGDVNWYENVDGFFMWRLVGSDGGGANWGNAVFALDLDGDADIDVLNAATHDAVAWPADRAVTLARCLVLRSPSRGRHQQSNAAKMS